MKIIFETERLYLRKVEIKDAKLLFNEININITRFWIWWEPPKTLEEEKEKIKKIITEWKENNWCIYLLAFLKESNEFIWVGSIDLIEDSKIHKNHEDVGFGIWLKENAQWKWYAYEIMTLIINWAKENTNFEYIIYSVTQGNNKSFKLAKKLKWKYFWSEYFLKNWKNRKVFDYKIFIR